MLDVGCGPASMLRLLDRKINFFGFDLTPSMITEAKKILKINKKKLWVGNALKKMIISKV